MNNTKWYKLENVEYTYVMEVIGGVVLRYGRPPASYPVSIVFIPGAKLTNFNVVG